ncbi:LamG domain-containing protein [Candidatus Sumerlaeota bacterium]|nr:LamG domain-containing protein [Candidatus Sumerlaeota bacterium]
MCKRTTICLLVFVVGAAMIASAADPVVWYKFDESSGTTAADSSTYGTAGALEDFTSPWSTDVPGAPFNYLDGPGAHSLQCVQGGGATSNRVVVPDGTGNNIPTGDITMSFMFKSASAAFPGASLTFLCKGQRSGIPQQYTVFCNATGNLSADITDGTTKVQANWQTAETDVFDGTWHHIVWVINRTVQDFVFYLDGVTPTDPAMTYSGGGDLPEVWDAIASIASSDPLYIANNSDKADNDRSFSGNLDDLRIYNTALSAFEITMMYAPTPDTSAGVEHWELFY